MTLRVVDPPEVPLGPYGRHKRFALSIFAGLFVGALISFLGIFALTKTGRTAYAPTSRARSSAAVRATPTSGRWRTPGSSRA